MVELVPAEGSSCRTIMQVDLMQSRRARKTKRRLDPDVRSMRILTAVGTEVSETILSRQRSDRQIVGSGWVSCADVRKKMQTAEGTSKSLCG